MNDIGAEIPRIEHAEKRPPGILDKKFTRRRGLGLATQAAALYGAGALARDLLRPTKLGQQIGDWFAEPAFGNDSHPNSVDNASISNSDIPPAQGLANESSPQSLAASSETLPTSEDPFIKAVEKRLGVRLVSLREAFRLRGVPFNEMDEKELAQLLPMRWDAERAALLEEIFSHLPSYFHEPDGHGNPLAITLTNFGRETRIGRYHLEDANHVMSLDFEGFTTKNLENAFFLLLHESIHYIQELRNPHIDEKNSPQYLKNPQFDKKINEIFGKEVKEFCSDTIKFLNSAQPKDENDSFVLERLRYGTEYSQDIDGFIETGVRENTVELEASLAEIYAHGTPYFFKYLKPVFGDKADTLYQYLRDEVFGSMTYDHLPVKNLTEQDIFNNEVSKVNEITESLMSPRGIELSGIPILNTEDLNTKSLKKKGLFTFKEETFYTEKSWSEYNVTYRENGEQSPIAVSQNIRLDGTLLNQSIRFTIDEEGQWIKDSKEKTIHKKGTLEKVARKLLNLPNTNFTWTNDGYQQGEGEVNKPDGRLERHTITLSEEGELEYSISLTEVA